METLDTIQSQQLLQPDKCYLAKDLDGETGDDEWAVILADSGKYVREAKGKLTQYNILHRYYYTPSRLYRMKPLGDDLC